jgi:hypothetical protein
MESHSEEFSHDEFVKISQCLLNKRYRLGPEIADRIAIQVWNKVKSKDIRDVARLTNSLSDVDWLIDIQMASLDWNVNSVTLT